MKESIEGKSSFPEEISEAQLQDNLKSSLRRSMANIKNVFIPSPGEIYLNSWQRRAVDLVGAIVVTPIITPPSITGNGLTAGNCA